MTANNSALGAHLYADEASHGEVSTTFDERLNVNNAVDASGLSQEMIELPRVQQYQNAGVHGARGVYGGTFTNSLYLTGHGSATSGAVTDSDLAVYLGRVIGNQTSTNAGGTVSTQGDEDDFVSLATPLDGSIIRLGSINDGRGNGQCYAVNDGSTVSLLTATDAAVNVADVIYAPENVYPDSNPTSATHVSTRHQLQTANQRYNTFGCWAQSIDFTGLNAGELPQVSVTHGVSRWAPESASTWPTSTSMDEFSPAPVAAGSFFLQTYGSTTRTKYDIRDFQLSIDLINVPLTGPGATDQFQIVTGVRRIGCQANFSFTIDAAAAGTDVFGDLWNVAKGSRVYHHVMYTMSAVDGRAVGFYFPKAKLVGTRPIQADQDGINRVRVSYMAVTDDTKTTELERSNFRIAIG